MKSNQRHSLKNETIYDVIVIGGGFYGSMLALFLKRFFKRVLLIEKEKEILTRASFNNQARVHNGYHYPRSFMTAFRSHANSSRFVADFKPAIDDTFKMIYAVARDSKVSSNQFIKLCQAIGSKIEPAPEAIKKLFNKNLIEDVFMVEEMAFDAVKLRKILVKKFKEKKIEVIYNCSVEKIDKENDYILVLASGGRKFITKHAFNCTYSQINSILKNSNLPILPFKYEFTEMPLVKLPEELRHFAFTIVDGPFFSFVPFPSKNLHTLHHVRYTPYNSISEAPKEIKKQKSKFLYMIKDIQRFIPSLSETKYMDSLYEIKTILVENDVNDGRPILFRKDYEIKNFHVVMGGKIDNIYDILDKVKSEFD